jgi:Zn finger protein HypA/HybF involved in hydrogenase expression
MSLWKWLVRSKPVRSALEAETKRPIRLPIEPYVFECRQCGKVFESRRRRPRCTECDSEDAELVSE